MDRIRNQFRETYNQLCEQTRDRIIKEFATTDMKIKNRNLTDDDMFVGLNVLHPNNAELVGPHLRSMNEFCLRDVKSIISTVFAINRDFENVANPEVVQKINLDIKFDNVELSNPVASISGSSSTDVYPIDAIRSGTTYASNLSITANIKVTVYNHDGTTQVINKTVRRDNICQFPIMVGSCKCNTYNKSPLIKQMKNEDPTDAGGYFVIGGNERSVLMSENITYNVPRCFRNNFQKEKTRLEFISKPGDQHENSNQIIIVQTTSHGIVIEIARNRFKQILIPFFLIFRVMGINSDLEMFNIILYGEPEDMRKIMIDHLTHAMTASYEEFHDAINHIDISSATSYLINTIANKVFPHLKNLADDNEYKQAHETLMFVFDNYMLSHIGLHDKRYEKLKYLGMLINRLIKVHLEKFPETDRDSLVNKRIHPAGISFGKALKTHFNLSIILQILEKYSDEFRQYPIKEIDVAKIFKSVDGSKFANAMIKFITTGNKATITVASRRKVTNRTVTQLMPNKNQLADLSVGRQIKSHDSKESSKSSSRSIVRRQVHSTHPGLICIFHSPEGESVGINKQLCMFTIVSQSTISQPIKDLISKDVINPSFTEAQYMKLYPVFVNGDLLGYTQNNFSFIKNLINIRRTTDLIDKTVSIYTDTLTDEVHVWCDPGRLLGLTFIVYNNIDNPEYFDVEYKGVNTGTFRQGILFNEKHVEAIHAELIDLNYMFQNRIMEYVGAGENINCLYAACYDDIIKHHDDECVIFTHCIIPQSLIGITALTSPMAHMNQTTRLTFQGNQGRSTCGFYRLNWPYRPDNDTYLQFKNEFPIVQTNASKYLFPNGMNVVVGMGMYMGYNMEDSIITNKSAIDRGLFNCCKFTAIEVIYENSQIIGIPNISQTLDTKASSYGHLDSQGIVPVGYVAQRDDIIISMYTAIPEQFNSEFKYKDCSSKWPYDEPGIVRSIFHGINDKNKQFIKIAFEKSRPVQSGDKFSSRAGQKGVCSIQMVQSELPCTADGIFPSIIINPHCMPTRMTIGQLNEVPISEYAANKSTFINGTISYPQDLKKIEDELKDMGLNPYGLKHCYSGLTGEEIEHPMNLGLTYYQRLQKMVKDNIQVSSKTSAESLTRQPPSGKLKFGGLRIGEMEAWVLFMHGGMHLLAEKLFDHSDGFGIYICANCQYHNTTVVNIEEKIYKCINCNNYSDIRRVNSSWTSKLLLYHELNGMGIGIRTKLSPFIKEIE
jgi:DNA-directed RNA polymerase II subunit RPB2